MSRHRLKSCATGVLFQAQLPGGMNNGIEEFGFRSRNSSYSISLQKIALGALGITRELPEQNDAQQQKLLSEFQAALGRDQTAWSEQAKALAQQSLNAGLQAAQKSTVLLLEEAARMNAAAVRKAFDEGASRIEHSLATGRRIAWLSLTAALVALVRRMSPSLCA